MVDVIGMIAAGMGLFFTGLKLVSGNFKQMASRRLRSLVARLTDSFWKAALLGVVSGAILQSTSAITFILTSMISSGLVTVRRALPIVTWCNVGSSALVFMAVLNLRMAVLYLLGIAGASFAFEKPVRYRNAVGAIFGIGMLFYGIELMKSGAAPLKDFPWFNQIIAEHSDSYALAFLGGNRSDMRRCRGAVLRRRAQALVLAAAKRIRCHADCGHGAGGDLFVGAGRNLGLQGGTTNSSAADRR
ncbi:MAG: Na/Pi symporter [Acidobacteriota bacterium]